MPGCATFYVAASGALLAAVVGSSFVKHPSDAIATHFTRSNLSILVASAFFKAGIETYLGKVCVNAACSVLVSLLFCSSSDSATPHAGAPVARPAGARSPAGTSPSPTTPAIDPLQRHSLVEERKKKMLEDSRAGYLAKQAALAAASVPK